MWFDLLILGILLFTTIRGAIKGVVWQLAAIASLVLCFVFAQSGSLAISPMIPLKPPANRWTAMFIIYLFSSLIAFGAARMLREGIEKAKFTEYDKHLGAIFGFLKGAVGSLVLIFFVATVSDSLRPTIMQTHSGHAAAIVMDRLHDVLPEDLLAKLEPYIHHLDAPGQDLKYGPGHDGHGHGHDHPHDHGLADDGRRDPGDPFSGSGGSGDGPFDRPRFEEFDRRGDFRDSGPPAPDERIGRDDPRSAPGYFDSAPRGNRPGEPDEIDFLGDLKKKLSGALAREAEDRVLRAFRNTSPEDRAELADRLGRALPSMVESIAEDWRNGRPSGPSPRGLPADGRGPSLEPVPRDPGGLDPFDRVSPAGRVDRGREPDFRAEPDGRGERDRLLTEIVEIYSDDRQEQDASRREFEEHLAGVPERVAMAVLRDWHHDLTSLDRDVDPDPETHFNSLLDVRILNQLKTARVPVSSLDAALRERLRDSERR